MVPLKPDFFWHLEGTGKAWASHRYLFWVSLLIGKGWAVTDTVSSYEVSSYETAASVPKGGPHSHPYCMATALPELTKWAGHQLGSFFFFFFLASQWSQLKSKINKYFKTVK